MIRKLIIRRFKRFDNAEFAFPATVVLAGPNNTGKTTALQAVAAWDLAFNTWRLLNDMHKRSDRPYRRAPIARQAFAAVPLRAFDLLWNERDYNGTIEIELHSTQGWHITMEFIKSSTEQIYVRPTRTTSSDMLQHATLNTVYIPPMTGLSTDEPVYRPAKQQQLLGQGKPGDIIRNLLVQAHDDSDVWEELSKSIKALFDHTILPPNAEGPNIIAEYETRTGARFDVASAGSGFQQVLMLLTFLYTRPASVLLLDEPDAHLHVLLQDSIYSKLRSVAMEQGSQLIISTHSEVIIDSVEPKELCMLLDQPRMLSDIGDRAKLIKALRYLSNTDIMLALKAPGVLYVEGHTDIDILREWAKILEHPLHAMLSKDLFWKPKEIQTRPDAPGCRAKEHFEILKLVRDDIRGVELIDGDDHKGSQTSTFEQGKLQRLRWHRYEIESYLFHPTALARFIERTVGKDNAKIGLEDMQHYLEENLPPAVIRAPMSDHAYLNNTKARTDLIPPALAAAGVPNFPYTHFFEIASVMLPEEIHPEVIEKLDAIQQAFGL